MGLKRWVLALLLMSAAAQSDESVEAKYLRSCSFCHEHGAAKAPKRGDTEAWAQRLEKGMEPLLESSLLGYQQMPPRGLCSDCSEADFKALINYMSKSVR